MPNTRRKLFPLPSVQFPRQVAQEVFPPFIGTISGELTASRSGMPLGIARFKGFITEVNMSALTVGKDDSNSPSGEVDVKINGVSCLSTRPYIRHLSGETSQQKTSYASAGDTGVRQSVINEAANDFNQGDVLTWDFIYGGDASPDADVMEAVCVIVEVEPDK